MKKLWRIFRRFTSVLLILLLVTVVGVALFVHMERSRVLLRDQLVTAMNASLRGEVRIGRIEGGFWRTFTLSDVTITYHNVETLRVPRLTARYDLFALWNGLIRVTGVEVEDPTIRLIQDAQGNWNLLEALSAKVPAEPTEAQAEGFAILLDTIAIQGATIEVTLAGQGTLPYRLAETNLLMQVAMKSGRTEVQVQQLMTQLHADPLPPVLVDATLTYQDKMTPATVHLANLTLKTPQSQLRVTGDISNLETLDTTADLVIEKLATAEIKQLVPTWPLTEDISGTLHINGPLSDLHTQLTVAATDARITGDIRADLKSEPLSYEGTITLSGFDTQKMLQRPDVSGVLDGTVKVRGRGTAVAALEGKADLTVRALAVSNWQLGTVTVSGGMAQQRGTITGTLASTLGRATWQGAIDLTSPRPRYQVNLALEHLDIKKAPSGMKPITSDLNLTVALSGQGATLSDIEARTDVSLRPSTIGPVTLDRGRLSAQMEKDRVHIAEFTLDAKETTVAVSGDIGTSSTQPGQLTYALHVGNVAPWLSLAEQQGTGALHLTGKAQGSISNLQLQGELQTQGLRVATNTIQDGSVTYQLENIGQPHPSGAITAKLQNIDAGVTLKHAEVKVHLPKNLQPTAPVLAQVDLSLQDAALRTHQLQGEVSYQAARVTARIATLTIETPDGRLTLAQPTQLVQEKDRITIEPLLMRNGAQEIQLAGQGGLSGPQDLHLRIDQVPLALLQTFASPRPEIGGLLTVDARITGTAAAPQLTSTLDVTGLRVAGQDYAGLVAALGYDSQRAALDLTFKQDSTHSLTATGTLPVIVKWADGWHAGGQGDMALQVRSSGLDLAFLNAFTDRTVNEVEGKLGLDLAVTGPVSNPQPRGSFALTHGQATLTPLGVQIEQVLVQGQVDPQAIRIVELSARSDDGRLTGSGEIALRDYLPQQLNLSLTADRWPVIHTPRYQVELDGQMNGQGSLSHPQVTGKLRILNATLRPDLEFLTAQPVQRDPTIMVLAADRAPMPAPATTAASDTPSPLPESKGEENLTLDVTIRLPRNTWVKHQDADIELAGKVHVTKQAGGKPILVGTINVVRGWLNLQRRRFTLTQGQVAFTGGEVVNPTLDIIAQYRLPQYIVEAVVGGTLEKPALTLRSDPTLEQADILALLLFGKPVNALGSEEKVSLQQQALQVTGGYVAAQIGESVSQALGLEDLGIDLRQVDLTGGRVGFGRYLGPKTYISASQDLSGKAGHEVSVDYYLSSQWKLNTSSSTGGSTGDDNAASITWEKRY